MFSLRDAVQADRVELVRRLKRGRHLDRRSLETQGEFRDRIQLGAGAAEETVSPGWEAQGNKLVTELDPMIAWAT